MLKKFLGAAVAVAFVASAASAAYVAGPLDVPTFGGGTVPADSDVFKAEQKASSAGSKLASAAAKCYSKGAKNASKGNPDGVTACLGTASGKYITTITGLTALPACHNYAGDGAAIVALVKGFQPFVYCASPSGAFVDGSAGL